MPLNCRFFEFFRNFEVKKSMAEIDFYKKNEGDRIWWIFEPHRIGCPRFTFDKKKIFYLYRDYHKMTKEQKELFDKENPFWADFFKP